VAAALITQGFDVVGLDPDPDVVRVAMEAGVQAVECSFLNYYRDEPFDVVLFSRSLHHIPDLDAAFTVLVHSYNPTD
jgi:SAM-dependent methyltransferase